MASLRREFQNAPGRSLRAGDVGAVASFLVICFAYGFFHALGLGHRKAVIAACGFASDSALRKMVGIAALPSLGQAAVAVALVYAGVLLWQGARENVEGLATRIEPVSMLAIAALGLFLTVLGMKRLLARDARHHAPAQGHHHDEHCGCGHAHAPDMAEISARRTWREAAALVLGIALRPCTGALFLLLLTWRFEVNALGILGAFVMGVGTFMITGDLPPHVHNESPWV